MYKHMLLQLSMNLLWTGSCCQVGGVAVKVLSELRFTGVVA